MTALGPAALTGGRGIARDSWLTLRASGGGGPTPCAAGERAASHTVHLTFGPIRADLLIAGLTGLRVIHAPVAGAQERETDERNEN